MKNGKNMKQLAAEITRLHDIKKDYALDTRSLIATQDGNLAINVGDRQQTLAPTSHCLRQIAERIKVPHSYIERMAQEAPVLMAQNLNHWFQATPEKRMLRTYAEKDNTGIARAFLSHRYRPLDNEDLLCAILPQMEKAGCEILSSEVTTKRLYVQARTKKIEGEIKKGDVVQAGVVISNSEVGAGSIRVEPMLYRLVCTNGMILPTALKKHHIGRQGDGDWDSGDAFEVFSDKTRQLDDKAFWAKVTDVLTDSLTQMRFDDNVKRMQAAAKVDTGEPIKAVELITKKFGLFKPEVDTVLRHLTLGGDLSQWGLANAVTRTAEDLEDYDRAVDFERMGGDIIELPASTWKN